MDKIKFIKKLRIYWKENEVPNITDTNAKFIWDLIKISKVKNMLEIWTANWLSAIFFWIELEKINWKLTSIEFSERSYIQATENIKEANLHNTIKLINWNALLEIPKLKEVYDFVFIDGMKRRTKDFLDLIRKKVKLNWIIIIDDVIKFKEKMIWLYEYLEENNIKYNIIPIDTDDGIMMIVKNWKENIFDKWNNLKKEIHTNNKIKSYKEREVWYINIWYNIWVESFWKWENFLRPILIFKKFDKNSFIWIPLSTKIKKWEYYFITNIKKTWIANIKQLKTFSSKRLCYKYSSMSTKDFLTLKNKVKSLL